MSLTVKFPNLYIPYVLVLATNEPIPTMMIKKMLSLSITIYIHKHRYLFSFMLQTKSCTFYLISYYKTKGNFLLLQIYHQFIYTIIQYWKSYKLKLFIFLVTTIPTSSAVSWINLFCCSSMWSGSCG